jgi:hypothetical protein
MSDLVKRLRECQDWAANPCLWGEALDRIEHPAEAGVTMNLSELSDPIEWWAYCKFHEHKKP